MNELHTKYRPTSWDEMVGHDHVRKAVARTLASGDARAFLFVGPPGVGKTTIARIIGNDLACPVGSGGFLEYDAATNTGVDDMRAILDTVKRRPIDGSPGRVVVIDECHMLSKQAWNSALKMVEEPPDGVVWVFCTTDGAKVPASIRSRCQEYVLGPVPDAALDVLLDRVLTAEDLFPLDDDVIDLLFEKAEGSPRAMLVGLGKIIGLSIDDARLTLTGSLGEDSAEAIELCRALLKGAAFPGLVSMVQAMQGRTTAEGVRQVVCAYFSKVAGGRDWKQAVPVLSAFGDPYPAGIGASLVPVIVSLARLMEEA